MTIEDRIKAVLAEQLFTIMSLQTVIEQRDAEIAELRKMLAKPEPQAETES